MDRARFSRRTVAGCVSVLLLLAGCGGAAPAAPSSGKPAAAAPVAAATPPPVARLTPVSFLTAWIPVANQLPWYEALDKGYFKQAGLDVTITSGAGSVTTAQQVGAGKADIGQTDLTVMSLARGKGEPLEAFYVEFPKSPFGVFAAKSTGITDFQGLKGHSLLVSAGSAEQFLLPPTLAKVGLSPSEIHEIAVAPSAKDGDYVAGKADALANEIPANEPFIQPKRPSNFLYFGSVLPVPYLGLFARASYIKAHPAVIRAFVAATSKGLRDLLASPQAVRQVADQVAASHTGVSAKVLVASWNDYQGFWQVPAQQGHPLGWMPPSMWQQTIALLHRYGGLNGDLNPSDYYTNQFVQAG